MKKYLLIIFLISCQSLLFSQEPPVKEKEVDAILDDLFMEDDVLNELMASLYNYQFLYVSVNYNSNTYFSGREIGLDQFNLSPQISYVHSKGFFASLSGTYYNEFIPSWDVTSVTAGYGHNIGSGNFRYYLAYSKYFYENDLVNPYTNSIGSGLSVGNKKRTLGTQLSAYYLFGEEQSIQVSLSSYGSIPIINSRNNRLKLRPQLSIITGKQTIELARITVQDDLIMTDYVENEIFDLINIQFNIPLQYSSKAFDVELGYNINFPNAIGDETDLKNTGFFNLRLAYLIDL